MPKGKPLVNVQIRAEQEVSELFDNTLQESDIPTRGRFLELLLERFLNPKTETVQVSMATDLEQIATLESRIQDLVNTNLELHARNSELQTAVAQSGVIPSGSILFLVSDQEQEIIENLKAWLTDNGLESTSELALYTAIRTRQIKR